MILRNARCNDKELCTDILRRQMGRAFANSFVVHTLLFGSEIGYYD